MQELNGADFNGTQLKVMRGESQPITSNAMLSGKENSWGKGSSAPSSRIPRENRPFSDQMGKFFNLKDVFVKIKILLVQFFFTFFVLNFFKGDLTITDSTNACRRCGEVGHFARECVNAPSMAFTKYFFSKFSKYSILPKMIFFN